MNYVLGKRISNILNNVIFPRENTNIDVSVFIIATKLHILARQADIFSINQFTSR